MKEIDAMILKATLDVEQTDQVLPFETTLLLLKDQALLGFYVGLNFCLRLGIIKMVSQKHLANIMGMSHPTFIARRNDLVKLGLLEVTISGNERSYRLFQPRRVKNFYLPQMPNKVPKMLDDARKSLYQGEISKENLLLITRNIYNSNNLSASNNVNPSKSDIGASPKKVGDMLGDSGTVAERLTRKGKSPKSAPRYPEEDYNKVLKAFFKYSGTVRKGPELAQSREAIKAMFRAGRTPDDIIKFMKWISEHKDDKEYTWLRYWTMWTVQKRLPDFLSGVLVTSEEDDDGFRQL